VSAERAVRESLGAVAGPEPLVLRGYDRRSDTELLGQLRRGDEQAFAELCDRHAAELRRYARRVLRAHHELGEDVVQEALARAHRALRRDQRHLHVRAYLFRIVRNCCLDELARLRTDSVALHLLRPGDEPASLSEPHEATLQRDATLNALADVAGLPAAQRHALVRRELDGLSHEELARELGVSVKATKNLVHRARANLARTAEARDARCDDIRHELLVAHDRHRRPPMHALRHAALCKDCRAFRTALKASRQRLATLVPAPAGLGLLALLAGGAKATATKATAGVAAAALAAGGAYELKTQVFNAGSAAPLAVQSVSVPGGLLSRGAKIPRGTAVVTGTLQVSPQPTPVAIRLKCPDGMRVAGLVPSGGDGLAHGFDPATVTGVSRSARVLIAADELKRARRVTVATLCRAPDGTGSVRADMARTGEPIVHSCAERAMLLAAPAGRAAGTVTSAEPLALLEGTKHWLRVRTGANRSGWLPAAVIC
jgi:RNA polymerase sigma factor (sigma-70 family)